jgi:hypothetical protein
MSKQKTYLDLSLATLEWALEKAIKVRKPKDFKTCIAFFEDSKDWLWDTSGVCGYMRKSGFYGGSFFVLNVIKNVCLGNLEIPKAWPEELLE